MNTAILGDDDSGDIESRATEGDAESSGVHPVQRLKRGDVIGNKYVVRGTLGAGGFAVVYEAEHPDLGRLVAIKVMHLEPEMPLQLLERFRLEARISAVVRHPNVLEIYDTGTLDDGSPYLVMELVQGETLFRRMSRKGLSIPALVEVATQLLTALEVIADRGIVHRDIKPENIMLHEAGNGALVVKVLDFGVSKHVSGGNLRLTRSGALVGTPHYMSPEQIRGEPVDLRSDLYAVGVVLYEALTGRVPYDGATLNALVLAALNSDAPPIRESRPDCPPELERIVLKAMARNREDRYACPSAMKQDLIELAMALGMPRGAEVWRDHSWAPPCQPSTVPTLEVRTLEVGDTLRAPPSLRWLRACKSKLRLRQVGWIAVAAGVGLAAVFVPRGLAPTASLLSGLSEKAQPSNASEGAEPAQQADHVEPTLSALQHVEVTQLVAAQAPGPAGLPAEEPAAPEPLAPSRAARPAAQAASTPRRASPEERLPIVQSLASQQLTSSAPGHAVELQEQPLRPSQAGAERAREAAPLAPRTSRPTSAQGRQGAEPARERDGATATTARRDHAKLVRDAMAAYVLGDLARAYTLYRKATERAPDAPEAWRGLGVVAARLGLYPEARHAFGRYLQLAPSAPDAGTIQARNDALP